MCYFINIPCIAYAMFNADSDPTTVGLLMTYAMSIAGSIRGIVYCQAGLENQLVVVERVYKIMDIQPEEKYAEYTKNWKP